jgi:hypothetical protein
VFLHICRTRCIICLPSVILTVRMPHVHVFLAASNCLDSSFSSAWCCGRDFLLCLLLTFTFSLFASCCGVQGQGVLSIFWGERNFRYFRKLFPTHFFHISSTQLPFPARIVILSRKKVCKPKTVLWYTGTSLSTCDTRQVSSHSTSNNPHWLQIPCTMLQKISEFSPRTR